MNNIEEKIFKISITNLFQIFEDHINIGSNDRILFSGKFGIGKTHFLNEFFEDKQDKYNVFHLFPVNYQISSNENMIQFLKYDILIELLKRGETFSKDNNLDKSFISFIKNEWTINSFLKGTIENTIELLPGDLGKLGKPLKTILEIDKKFQEFKNTEGKTKVEIDNFLKEHNTESDVISEIIKKKIQESKNKKENILIIDDLERIDPEHIFRILNVFSAHFDLRNNELKNKFGFDKIILVADIQNLKNIFYHKYGKDTDSNGYFDKFFSVEVFQLENKEIVSSAVDEIISHFLIEDTTNLSEALGNRGFLRIFLKNIITNSLELPGKEKLNLRQLLRGTKFPLRAFGYGSYRQGFTQSETIPQFINLSIKALISIFGGIENDFLTVLNKIKERLIIKNKGDEDISYKAFSRYLLYKIAPFDRTQKDLRYGWAEYLILLNNGEIIKVENKQNIEINGEILFFDLLTEYIKKGHYLKHVDL